MNEFVIAPPQPVTLPVRDSDRRFPVRRIYCIGRNYAEHAVEMGHDPDKEDPFFFQKNPDNITLSGEFPYPPQSQNVHYELEMAIALKAGGRDIALSDALERVFGYAVGLDMTRRDLQSQMKKTGRPWEIGKAFEKSAPMGEVVPAADIGHPSQGAICLEVNGEVQQKGDINQMIWKVPEIISYLSSYFELAAGDLILTGTPAGVGPVQPGDTLSGTIEGVGTLEVKVV